jgi:hypothetical protein
MQELEDMNSKGLLDIEIYIQIYDNIFFLEKKVLQREYEYFGIHLRYISDLLITLVKYYLRRIGVKKSRVDKLLNFESLKNFSDTISQDNRFEKLQYLYRASNHFAHKSQKHIKDLHGEPRLNALTFDEAIKYLKVIHDIFN